MTDFVVRILCLVESINPAASRHWVKWTVTGLSGLCFLGVATGQADRYINKRFDVTAYHHNIRLSDKSDVIVGTTVITLNTSADLDALTLDLANPERAGYCCVVDSIAVDGVPVSSYDHQDDVLTITGGRFARREAHEVWISYHGKPVDGLIIGRNTYGNRTFFGDNWPNRAHKWFPCVDHSSDKALTRWTVEAPSQYSVVANGKFLQRNLLDNGNALTTWASSVPLAPKVMVIGVADFAVDTAGIVDDVPVTSWVYPENREAGFSDYRIATGVLAYFAEQIGPYPWAKLANVQSTTRYGGMENAGNIFYMERSVDGKGTAELLIAHEVAHQWFGNSATETDWAHVWLSEGFATYLTNAYCNERFGMDSTRSRWLDQREAVLRFARQKQWPVVNYDVSDYMQLLNANSYQKGAWVLHMLCDLVGEDSFWKGIREYYRKHAHANASTDDFRKVMEDVSGVKLKRFFRQWLFTPGHPVLDLNVKSGKKNLTLIEQVQGQKFRFPIDIELTYADGSIDVIQAEMRSRKLKLKPPNSREIVAVRLDPGVKLLFEIVE